MKTKIIWSIDAFEEETIIQKNILTALRKIAELTNISLELVYLLNPLDENFPLNYWNEASVAYKTVAEARMNSVIKRLEISNILPPKVLTLTKLASTTEAAKTLIDYAKTQSADFIITGTHGRHGFDRLVLGSFAETLLMHSEVPVLLCGKVSNNTNFNKIVFPTDFEKSSAQALSNIASLSGNWKAQLTLLHLDTHPVIDGAVKALLEPMGGVWAGLNNVLSGSLEKSKKKLEELAAPLRTKDSRIETAVMKPSSGIAQGILNFAYDNNAGIIAMAAHSGATSATMFGSICRSVARESSCPVLVIRA